jgi:hypothetical protein
MNEDTKKPIDPNLRALAMILARKAVEDLRAGNLPASPEIKDETMRPVTPAPKKRQRRAK